MTALAADVAKYTNDGVVVTTNVATGNAIAALHPDAQAGAEIPMFFDSAVVGQAMLDEKFSYQSQVDPPHLGVEVESALELGTVIPVTPTIPSFTAVDPTRQLNRGLRTRAYSQDTATDRYSVELIA